MFEYRQEILAVYRARSFTKAAAELFVSQPALSATIKKAEKALGFEIFERAARPLRVTVEGMTYVNALLEVERLERTTAEAVSRIRGLETGKVVVGGSTVFASLYLPRIIQRFSADHPLIDVQLREGSTDQLLALVEAGEVDVVLDNCTAPSDLFDGVEIATERLCLAMREQAAPDWMKAVAVTQDRIGSAIPFELKSEHFSEMPLVMLRRGNDTADRLYKLASRAGAEPRVAFQTEQLMTAFNVAASGLGATVLSDGLVRLLPYDAPMLYLPLEGEAACRGIHLFHLRGSLAPAVAAFVKTAERAFA